MAMMLAPATVRSTESGSGESKTMCVCPVRRRGEASTERTVEAGSLAHGEAGASVAREDSERAGEDRGMRNETPYAAQPATAREERGASEASDANHAPVGAQ